MTPELNVKQQEFVDSVLDVLIELYDLNNSILAHTELKTEEVDESLLLLITHLESCLGLVVQSPELAERAYSSWQEYLQTHPDLIQV